MRLRLCALLLLAGALPPTAPAQRVEARFEAGVTAFADDGVERHLALGAALRAYLSRRWSVEPEFLYLRHNDAFVRHRDYLFWGNVACDLRPRDNAVIPYWFAAPGVIHRRTGFSGRTFSSSEAAFGTGAGVRFVSGRVFVAPQVRIGLADGIFAEFTGSIGLVLRK